MTENPSIAVKQWCDKNLSEKMISELDQGKASAVDLYRNFAANGWLQYASVFQDKNNLHVLMQILKITSRYSSDLCNMIAVNSVGAILLNTFGDDRQKEIAQKTFAGAALLSFSLTEPDAGSDIQNLKTSANRVDGRWILSGKKYLATGAAIADYILVVSRTHLDKPVNRGISIFLVPGNINGITVSAQEKIATNGFASCEIDLTSVSLPDTAIVGARDMAWGAIAFAGGLERLMVAATCVGLSRHMLKYVYEYTQNRIIQGKPLFDIQLINHQLADMTIKIHAADLMVKNAINLLLEGKTPTVEICGAKVFASETQQEMSMCAMRIIGGRGYLKAYPVERWMREGLLSLYAGGTNELQKNIIARKIHTVLDVDAA